MRLMLVSLAQVVLVLSPSADTGVDCGDWPNARFFEIASPNNVLDCLATGADPNVRAGLAGRLCMLRLGSASTQRSSRRSSPREPTWKRGAGLA